MHVLSAFRICKLVSMISWATLFVLPISTWGEDISTGDCSVVVNDASTGQVTVIQNCSESTPPPKVYPSISIDEGQEYATETLGRSVKSVITFTNVNDESQYIVALAPDVDGLTVKYNLPSDDEHADSGGEEKCALFILKGFLTQYAVRPTCFNPQEFGVVDADGDGAMEVFSIDADQSNSGSSLSGYFLWVFSTKDEKTYAAAISRYIGGIDTSDVTYSPNIPTAVRNWMLAKLIETDLVDGKTIPPSTADTSTITLDDLILEWSRKNGAIKEGTLKNEGYAGNLIKPDDTICQVETNTHIISVVFKNGVYAYDKIADKTYFVFGAGAYDFVSAQVAVIGNTAYFDEVRYDISTRTLGAEDFHDILSWISNCNSIDGCKTCE